MTSKLFSEFGLSEEVLKAIERLGFEQAAPIQAAAIPLLQQGRDVVGQSQTGSGKTAAFGIPAVELADPANRAVQVLILCPTRELAIQVSEEIHKLAFFKRGLHALPIYGGQSYERQFHGLQRGAQIVIGTPGRIMDHMRRGTLRLDTVKLAVLDEADEMLNMGFRDDIELILQAVPKERQTVFFSATMPRPIRELIEKYSRNPESVKIEQKALTVPTVEQFYYEVDRRFKVELLERLIDLHDFKLGLIFCNTKRMVDDLVDHLEAAGYLADRLHGDMSQNLRDRVMNKFRKSGLEFLVATDVAARGIDVDDVQVVFNYDLPYDGEDYVHRIGRTGRAGRSGCAITFVSGRELYLIRQIERYTNTRIQRGRIPTMAEVEEARENVFLGRIRATLQAGDFKQQDRLVERLLAEGFSSTDIAAACLAQLQTGEEWGSQPGPEPHARPDRPDRESRRAPRGERPAPRRFTRPEPVRPSASRPESPALVRASPPPGPAEPAESPIPGDASVAVHPAEGPAVVSENRLEPATPSPQPNKLRPAFRAGSARDRSASTDKPLPPWLRGERDQPREQRDVRSSRRTSGEFTRLHLGVGAAMGVAPGDIVGAISGETGLPTQVVGLIDIRERHSFVEVAAEHARAILSRLNRTQIRGHRVRAKVA